MARYGQQFKERVVARLLPPESSPVAEESMQSCGVHYAANAIASSSFAGRKPGLR
jgi:hypothetical protein